MLTKAISDDEVDAMQAAQYAQFSVLGVAGLGLAIVFFLTWRKDRRALKHFRRDMRHVKTSYECVSCGGQNTELVTDNETDAYICRDRDLCRTTIIYRSMLDSILAVACNADRYLITGAPLTAIYPGDLTGLNRALKDCLQTSRHAPDLTIRLFALYGKERSLLRVFMEGENTVTYDQE